jgi:HD superfamily phosphohydrolase
MGLPELPRHESLVHPLLTAGELATIIETEWGIAPARVASLVAGTAADPAGRLLCSLLSGPIDVDKMDYLSRDSLHAGVPYGRHFDQERLLSSLCLDESGETLAITEKGRTAAELMVFARYVMFSEVYWHHAVRAATAMLQRSIWLVRESIEPARLTRFDDREFGDWLVSAARASGAARLVDGLFGPARRLVKRAGSFDALHHPQIHRALAGRSYADSVAISHRLAERLSRRIGTAIAADTLLIDAPPAEREVEFRLEVRERTEARSATSRYRWRSLAELSPVVRSLAHEQFDNLVKRVRLFAPAESAAAIAECDGLDELILEAAG